MYQLVNVSVGQNLFISTGMDNFPEDAHEVAGLDIFWAAENLISFYEKQEREMDPFDMILKH